MLEFTSFRTTSKLKEFCLEEYKKVLDAKFREMDEDIMGELVSKDKSFKDRDFDKIIPDSVGLRKLLNDKAKLVKDSIREDLKEVVLESVQDRNNRIKESASISDYRHCGSDRQIIEYVRNTDITGLCTMGCTVIESPEQEKGLVKADAVVKNLKGKVNRINGQLKSVTKEHKLYESEINEYSNFIKGVKNRTILLDWYNELLKQVKEDSDKNAAHVLHNYNKSELDTNVNNWLIDQIFDKVLDNKLEELRKTYQVEKADIEYPEGKNSLKQEVRKVSQPVILDPKKFVSAMQSAPSELRSNKERVSKVVIDEIKAIETLVNEAKETLEELSLKATEDWKKDESNELKVRNFLTILSQELSKSILKLSNTGDHLLDLQSNHLESVKHTLSKWVENEDRFIEKILVEVLKKREYHRLALTLTIQLIEPHNVIEAEQDILDTILLKTIEKDKKDMALLLICNGANINKSGVTTGLGGELLETVAVEEIARLYREMPVIGTKYRKTKDGDWEITGFTVTQPHTRKLSEDEKIIEFCKVVSLEELSELFPEDSFPKKSSDIAIDYRKKISEGKLERVKDAKQTGMEQVTQHLEAKEHKKLIRNCSIGGVGVGGGAAAIGYSFALFSGPIAIGVFAGILVLSLAGSQGYYKLLKEKSDLVISRDDIKDLNQAINLLEELLQENILLGTNNTILKEIRQEKEEINKGKEKWVNISKLKKLISEIKVKGQKDVIFKEKKWKDDAKLIALLIADFEFELDAINKIEGITFEKFAKEIIENRRDYIQSLKEQDIKDKERETIKILSTECSKQASLLNTIARKAKQDKEKDGQEIEEVQARVKAVRLMYGEAEDLFNIPGKRIRHNQAIEEFLEQQYTFLVLNTDYKEKLKGICSEYRSLKEELKSKQSIGKEEFDKLSELADEFNRANKNFIQRKDKENESAKDNLKFDDEAINELRSHVIEEIKLARVVAEQERTVSEKEKTEVEEIVKQLQMSNSVSSSFDNVSLEPVAGPSWQI
ncbi:hypothetical protein [Wolbachia endosymbiont (group A) of Cydia strobilella]|uniref:coiled-coil domain-containing protein n=1 Tax=Wolbachia endosymbiont (group A) of Cydia strobilella TaxID=3066170 RepID=UPI003132EB3F